MLFRGGGVLLFTLALILHLGWTQEDDFSLFVADAYGYIHVLDSDLNLRNQYTIDAQVIGITVDPNSTHDDQTIVYSTMSQTSFDIRKLFVETNKAAKLFDSFGNQAFVDRLVIEPVSRNIYYTGVSWPDKGNSFIAVLTSENENKIIIRDLDEPRDIILDPKRRKLYYTDHGITRQSHIGYAYLDGSEHGKLIDTDIDWPSGLTIDFKADILYWSDSLLHKIESYHLNTGDRNIWLEFPVGVMPMDILLDGDFMYYVQYTLPNVTKLRMSDKQAVASRTHDVVGLSRLDALAIYSSNTRGQLTGISGCSERDGLGDCSNVCLPSKEGHVCACADGHQMIEDGNTGSTCDNAQQCPTTFTHGYVDETCRRYNRDICEFYCNEGASPKVETITCDNGEWDTRIAPCESDNENYRLFVTDAHGHVYGIDAGGNVLQTYNILGRQESASVQPVGIAISPHARSFDMDYVFSTLEPFTYEGMAFSDGYVYMMHAESQEKEMIFNLNERIASGSIYFAVYADRFAVEPITKNIYFTVVVKQRTTSGLGNTGSSLICVLSPKGDFSAILGGLIEPRDIVLHPARQLLFWTDHYYHEESFEYPHIGQAYMDGTGAHLILKRDKTDMVWPNGLAIDTKQDYLYWSDGYLGIMGRYNIIDETWTALFSVPNSQLMDILIDGVWLYYLDWKNTGVITKVNLEDLSDIIPITIPGAQRLDAMTLFSPNTHEIIGSTECTKRKGRGDCSNICTTNSEGQSCLCDYGVDINNNAKTCTNAILCDDGISNGYLSGTCLMHDIEECETVCNSGYSPVLSKIKCENGLWNASDNCRKDCSNIGSVDFGTVTLSRGKMHGSEANFKCNMGYKLKSQVTRLCENGKWTNSNPVCDIIVCEETLAPPENGFVSTPNGNTFLKMAEYECNIGYNLEGAPQRMCTMNGEWEGREPSCKIKECPDLTSPEHGMVSYNTHVYESAAQYSCDPGFRLNGPDIATCLWDGNWSDPPTCERIQCPGLANPEHGFVLYANPPEYESEARYSCEQGFLLNGPEIATCQWDGTWSEQPTCERIQCPDLTNPEHGVVSYDTHVYESAAEYSCDPGFRLNGPDIATCLWDGNWSDPPTCERIQCLVLANPEHGFVLYPSPPEYESEARYSCEQGFLLNGEIIVTCQWDGTWSEQPTCERIQCLDLAYPEHGNVEYTDPPEYESEALYSCDSGFFVNGPETVTCQWDGTWSDTPTCDRIQCLDLAYPEHGNVQYPDPPEYESEARYSCDSGFFLNGPESVTCQWNGTWSEPPTCERIQCLDLAYPEHGNVQYPDPPEYESEARYSCDSGFFLNGPETVTCEWNGTWSEPPTCERIQCRQLVPPDHGSLSFTNDIYFESNATFVCDDGYRINGLEDFMEIIIRCESNGDWSAVEPVCQAVECPYADVDNIANGEFKGDYIYTGHTEINCNDGYTLEGEAICEPNGFWRQPLPICQPVDCGRLDIEYGQFFTQGSTTFGATAYVFCNDGYVIREPDGEIETQCLDTAEWSIKPSCEPVECPHEHVDNIANGEFKGDYIYTGHTEISCNYGYKLEGEAVCESYGFWRQPLPTCQPVECLALEAPEYGSVYYESFQYESEAQFECIPGFELDGPEYVRCQANKTWSGLAPPTCEGNKCQTMDISEFDDFPETGSSWIQPSPACVRIKCDPLDPPRDGSVDDGGAEFEAVATYSCNTGFVPDGPVTSSCTAEGEWSQPPPACNKIQCNPLDPPQDGSVDDAGAEFGSVATYSCNTGFVLDGPVTSSCTAEGEWSQPPPGCNKIQCDSLDAPRDGTVDDDGAEFESVATYSCNRGFVPDGPVTSSCTAEGEWSQPPPACNKIQCDSLDAPRDGTVDADGAEFESVATYSCNRGFVPDGPVTSSCTAEGEWSQPPPGCNKIQCDPLDAPKDGSVDDDGAEFGSVATYSCNTGFVLDGPVTSSCTAEGEWSEPPPSCNRIQCDSLDAPRDGMVDDDGAEFGSVATYSCNTGFAPDGPVTSSCTTEGEWSQPPPACNKIQCDPLDAPRDGSVDDDGAEFGSVATYSCKTGFVLDGAVTSSCTDEGEWSQLPPACNKIQCPEIEASEHGSVEFINRFFYESTATFACDNGYTIGDQTHTLMCQEDGTWSAAIPSCQPLDTTTTTTTTTAPTTTTTTPTTTLTWPADLGGSTGSFVKPGVITMLTLLLIIIMF